MSEWLKESRILRDVLGPSLSKYKVYILKSLKDGKYYIGSTQSIGKRMIAHENGSVKSTKFRRPLQLIYTEIFNSRKDAIEREKKIKSFKGGKAFKQLLGNP